MFVQSYLFYEGRCEEAIEFYKQAVGAKVEMLMRYRESPEPAQMPPGADDKVLHACFRIGDTAVMASDGHCSGKPDFKGFGLSITVKTEADADRTFNALGNGGKVLMPLTKTFFSPRFGMLSDKFGVMWMVIVMADQPVPRKA